jgi:hypothetical protein
MSEKNNVGKKITLFIKSILEANITKAYNNTEFRPIN